MTAISVHVGGHVTLLFSIHSDALLARRQGSRGAGMCLENGALAVVDFHSEEGDSITVTSMDGSELQKGDALYVNLLEDFREIFKVTDSVSLELALELPVSQGFGMSAAGLLATSLALGEFFDVGDVSQLARLAHRIERKHSTGLGDILGLWAGGVELREVPGSPPSPGKARSFFANVPALLIWAPGDTKHTSGYIDDPEWKIAITKAGDKSVNHLMQYPWDRNIWPELLSEADRFAIDSGLLEEKERSDLLATVIENIGDNMSCHLCMLGTSVIIVPNNINKPIDCDEVASNLRSLGLGVFETRLQ